VAHLGVRENRVKRVGSFGALGFLLLEEREGWRLDHDVSHRPMLQVTDLWASVLVQIVA
jgi:hypothetical protein